jgi:hypothetical protein
MSGLIVLVALAGRPEACAELDRYACAHLVAGEPNLDERVRMSRDLCLEGEAIACAVVAEEALRGRRGDPEALRRSFTWFREACDLGHGVMCGYPAHLLIMSDAPEWERAANWSSRACGRGVQEDCLLTVELRVRAGSPVTPEALEAARAEYSRVYRESLSEPERYSTVQRLESFLDGTAP